LISLTSFTVMNRMVSSPKSVRLSPRGIVQQKAPRNNGLAAEQGNQTLGPSFGVVGSIGESGLGEENTYASQPREPSAAGATIKHPPTPSFSFPRRYPALRHMSRG
jgi:hypothetical protein